MYKHKYQHLLDQMTLEDKVALCSGADSWRTKAFEKYNIPTIMMTDGPHGLRKEASGKGFEFGKNIPATCFPTACTTACSWDRELLHEMGEAMAEEALQEGVSIILGPGVNIKRNPLCGRNFEYFSEDPYLAGELGESLIKGIQSMGIGVSLKHFAANNQETLRQSSDSLIDERSLREIYLPAFEKVVKHARPATIMCAYNKLNGVYCSEHVYLLREILRDEWGFEGVVVSDWGAINDRVESFMAGMDLEMPNSAGFFDQVVIEAVKSGALPVERINESVNRLLELIFVGSNNRKAGFEYDVEAHQRLAQKIAVNSAVLLKNEHDLLPLRKNQNIALIGALAKEPRYQGAGSSYVTPNRLTNAIDGFEAGKLSYTFHPGYELIGPTRELMIQEAVTVAGSCDIAVIFAGLPAVIESEGYDRTDMQLPVAQNRLIEQVAQSNPNTVVVLTAGAPVEMPWLPRVKAVLDMHLSGQEGGLAVVELLTGAVNPSGKLAESYPLHYEDVPSAGFYETGGRQAQYREGIYVGYRFYDTAKKEVCFPFGHGLSYTTFVYHNLKLSRTEMDTSGELVVSALIQNTGTVDGAEVVQLYVSASGGAIYRPEKELKDFTKIFLKAGETKEVDFHLNFRSFACYDPLVKAWIVPDGEYYVSLASSSRDIRLQGKIRLYGKQVSAEHANTHTWYFHPTGHPSQADFEALLGRPIDPVPQPHKGEYNLSSSLQDMQINPVIRLVKSILLKSVIKNIGSANHADPNFKMIIQCLETNPLQALALASSGRFTANMAQGLVEIANGHFFNGLKLLRRKDSQIT